MSSILKALKKLEEEKVARNPESLNINAELLTGGGASKGTSVFKSVAFGVLLAVCGASAMYFYMKKGAAPAPAPIPADSSALHAGTAGSEQVKNTPPLPVPTARIVTEKITPAAPLIVGKQPAAVQEKPAKLKTQTQIQTAKAPTKPAAASSIALRGDEQAKTVTVLPKTSAVTPAAQLPALKVSGIAYQDGVDSVAMINGVTASNGSVVEGARVDRILRDRVQFSYGTEKFEIQLGKSNR